MSELLLGEDNPSKKTKLSEQEVALRALKVLREYVPNVPENLAVVYARIGIGEDGFTCIAAKWLAETNKGYRIHYHEGLHPSMDQSLPNRRLRCLDEITYGEYHPEGGTSKSLVPGTQLFRN